ncbi:TIGR01906 family membrane protein [Citricoccus muralis]|uniref:TIGR01906 family membrane protein n=1 Tax=Citricoccus muralis TaxID=169134 RepID=A0ABY8H9U1_9MICC|nr:TIGR01906 family membrane protein [Citricoccus muralis]WFP17397.1 TIGR01906 family membrane protein [Citricoccus muralis]
MTTQDPEQQDPKATSEDFESGLDYSAFIDDEPENTADADAESTTEAPTTETPRFLQDSDADAETTPIARQTELDHEHDAQPDDAQPDDAQHTEVIGDAETTDLTSEEPQHTEVIGEADDHQHTEVISDQEPTADSPAAEHNYTVPLPDLSADQKTGDPTGAGDTGDTRVLHKTATEAEPVDPFTGVAAVPASAGMGHAETDRRTRREAEARAMARDEALESPRTVSRVLQVLLAIFAPIVLLIAAIRLVASPMFLWLEYRRPGFPSDDFGFSTEDRTVYGSYGLDYLFNLSNSRYLSELTSGEGQSLFTAEEVSHMHDVKIVMLITMLAGIVLGLACLAFMIILARTRKGGIRRGLFAGAVWLIVATIGLAVVAVLGWEAFFAGFHSLFFADGTWTFYASDTLIRLYPNQFWIDAGIAVAALTLITAIVTLVFTWPTRRRREDSKQDQIQLITRKNYWSSESAR